MTLLTFDGVIESTLFDHVGHYDRLELPLAIFLGEEFPHPCGFVIITRGSSYTVARVEELICDMRSYVPIHARDKYEGPWWDSGSFALEIVTHDEVLKADTLIRV